MKLIFVNLLSSVTASTCLDSPTDLRVDHQPLSIWRRTPRIHIKKLESCLSSCPLAWHILVRSRRAREELPHDIDQPQTILALCQLSDPVVLKHIKAIATSNDVIIDSKGILFIVIEGAFFTFDSPHKKTHIHKLRVELFIRELSDPS